MGETNENPSRTRRQVRVQGVRLCFLFLIGSSKVVTLAQLISGGGKDKKQSLTLRTEPDPLDGGVHGRRVCKNRKVLKAGRRIRQPRREQRIRLREVDRKTRTVA